MACVGQKHKNVGPKPIQLQFGGNMPFVSYVSCLGVLYNESKLRSI